MRVGLLGTLIAAAIAGALRFAPAYGASTAQVDHVALDISLEAPAKPGSTVWVAIRQVIAPGWHTYWRNPGDSGLATSISWSFPKGITAGDPEWPVPERFTTGPIVNFGYKDEATLLVPLMVARDAEIGAKPVRAQIFLLECAQMCVPEQATLDLDLRKASGSLAIFVKARAAIPRAFMGSAHVAVDVEGLSLTLTDPVLAGASRMTARFYPATTRAVSYDEPSSLRVRGDALTWRAARPAHAKSFEKFDGVLILGGDRAFSVTASTIAASAPPSTDTLTLAEAVVFAFLGGLILNLMPCVLPILSMKTLALVRSGEDSRSLRRDGVFYFAGVLATFAVIASSLLVLKAGGAALGWGFQLQSPLVVFALALLMTAVGLNLLGAFDIPLRFADIGDDFAQARGGQGAFFTGALAVLVASPCTAPFMGTAVGFALTQSAASAMVVFLALGTGFALPFSVIAFTPALIHLVPKPGPWMTRLREFLAFPMFATAIWLIWILSRQTGPDGLAVSLLAGLAFVFLAWLLRIVGPRLRWFVGAAGLTVVIAIGLNIRPMMPSANDIWAPWSPQAVTGALRARKPVLVDFSAAWCVTCLVNERVALNDATVADRLRRDRVVMLKGDWTSRNPDITAELSRYGRSGVPLYLLYPSNSEGGAIELPQLLTPSLVLSALGKMESVQRAP